MGHLKPQIIPDYRISRFSLEASPTYGDQQMGRVGGRHLGCASPASALSHQARFTKAPIVGADRDFRDVEHVRDRFD